MNPLQGIPQFRNCRAFALLFLLTLTPIADAQHQPPPLRVEDALNVRAIPETSPLVFSSKGLLAFSVRETSRLEARNKGYEQFARTGISIDIQGSDIWVSDGKETPRNLTGGRGSNSGSSWSPDGRYLAFVSDRDGSGQAKLWVWDSQNDKLRLVSNQFLRIHPVLNRILWTKDSRSVLVGVLPEGISPEKYVQDRLLFEHTSRENSGIAQAAVRLYQAWPARESVEASTATKGDELDTQYLHDLVRIEIETGASTKIVRGSRIAWAELSPNGSLLGYAVPKRFADPGVSFQLVYDLRVLDLASGDDHIVAGNVLMNDVFAWSPTGTQLCWRSHDPSETVNDYFVVGLTDTPPRNISHFPASHSAGDWWARPVWDKRGEHLYFVYNGGLWESSGQAESARQIARVPGRTIRYLVGGPNSELWSSAVDHSAVALTHDDEGKRDGFYRIDLATGKATVLREGQQCYTCKWQADLPSIITSVSSDGRRIAYVAEDAGHPPDIWIEDAEFHERRQLTQLNPQLREYIMGRPRVIEWLSDEGERLHGALLLPSNYEADKRYPLLVWVYPTRLSDRFDLFGFGDFPGPFNMQLFATRGYAVLLPDSGRRTGQPMRDLSGAVLPGINRAIEIGVADPDRLGVLGQSSGGYATLALLAQTTRFRAALEAAGHGNLIGFYGLMHEDGSNFHGLGDAWLGGPPWKYPNRYIQNSPLFFLDRISTPLLMVQGTADTQVAQFLGDEIFVGLRSLQKRVDYVKYEGEDHGARDWSYANQLDLANRAIHWFDGYLKEEAAIPTNSHEKVPERQ
jgi:dipeptidyl aminopeptidase/acylaminoacyl peptidase